MIDKFIELCRAHLGYNSITDEQLDTTIKFISQLYPNIDTKQARKVLAQMYNISIEPYKKLVGADSRTPWYNYFKANNPDKVDKGFWARYKTYLQTEKKYSPDIINSTDRLTNDIIDSLFDPNQRKVEIDKKGLVVGHVQSGKTGNFTALMCKAADAGFNLIIVLAGIHNSLRSQTQNRLDEEFLGFDTQYRRVYEQNGEYTIGVGKINGYNKTIASSITTSEQKGDFTNKSAGGISFNTSDTLIMVVKKNSTKLKCLKSWLEVQEKVNGRIESKSLLIIDDEADNASVNTKKESEKPSAINGLIRDIQKLFYRKAYVGYTATPFANIFINSDKPDDLFPKDFIISLPAPDNYIGPSKIFGTSLDVNENDDLLPICHKITDYETIFPKTQKIDGNLPEILPQSLITAIECFVVTCAIRIARGKENTHNSMLIHTVRYKVWQDRVRDLVEKEFGYIQTGVRQNDSYIIERLRKIFEVDTDTYKSYVTTTKEILSSSYKDIDPYIQVHTWDEIKPHLRKAIDRITLKTINGNSKDSLEYYDNREKGLYVIAIGGDKLSRGLTLEGLSVSYYLRASKMYDTLMQMGRWFGYRLGYVDLCRLFTSPELNRWFCHITLANEELHSEFEALDRAGGTPDSYALKVRTAPEQLQITALTKMRTSTIVELSWAGRLAETYQIPLDRGILKKNLITTQSFLESLGETSKKGEDYLWQNVNAESICGFFEKFNIVEDLKKLNLTLISNYIRKLVNDYGELSSWNVCLKSVNNEAGKVFKLSNGINVGCSFRNADDKNSENVYYIRKNHIVGSAEDELIDIPDEIKSLALKDSNWDKKYPKPELVRKNVMYRSPENPLLIIYPLDPRGANTWKDRKLTAMVIDRGFSLSDDPIIGFAIAFPNSNYGSNATVKYAINECLIQEFYESEAEYDNNAEDNDDE